MNTFFMNYKHEQKKIVSTTEHQDSKAFISIKNI